MPAPANGPVVVVGTIFVDVKAFPHQRLDPRNRNVGKAIFTHGGVGRNIAETLARLGLGIRFVSSVDRGGVGPDVLERLRTVGVDLEGVAVAEENGMGMWVAVFDRGDVYAQVSHQPDFGPMTSRWRRLGPAILQGARLAVLEFDLTPELTDLTLTMAAAAGVPVVALPGNMSVVRSHPELLTRCHAWICNQAEAEELVGRPLPGSTDVMHAAAELCGRGIHTVVVTMGAAGAVWCSSGGDAQHVHADEVSVVDTTGAGDAFVAGLSSAIAAGLSLEQAVRWGTRIAGWTCASSESVPPELAQRVTADPLFAHGDGARWA